jgi:hypothetical protein
MVYQSAFADVDHFVVAVRIGWEKEETGIDKVADGVVDDAFHDFAIDKLEAHPDAVDDGRAGVEVENLVIRVAVEIVDVEDGFDILGGDIFHEVGI